MILSPSRAAGRRTISVRAITAVVALYALVLHAVLGGLVPLPSAPGHGILCLGLSEADGTVSVASGSQAPDAGYHAHPPCCTVPGAVVAGLPPEAATGTLAWPARATVRPAWRPEAAVSARAPPGTIAHPRGPPVV